MGLQGLPQRNLHQFILWKVAPSRMLVLQDQEWLQIWWKSAFMHIVRLMNNLVKGPKRIDDKSAVAMLKKNDLHESVWEPVINHGKNHDRSGRPDKNRELCISRHEATEVHSPEEHKYAETNPTCKIHESYCTSHSNSRPKSFARIYLPRNLMSAAPTLQNLRIGLKKRQSGKSKVPAKQRGGWPKVC